MAPLPPRPVVVAVLAARRALLAAADRLVPADAALWDATMGIARTQVAGALAEVGAPDALARGPRTAEDLAGELGCDADALHRVLRAGAALGLTRALGDGRFALARLGRPLTSDHPASLRAWARYMAAESTTRAWAALGDAVRRGEPAFPLVHGTSVWSWFADHPDEERRFAESMRRLTEQQAPGLVAAGDWPERGVVCDVAGGVGTLLAAVLEARPGLRGVLVDAPGVLAEAEAYLAARGVRDRVDLVPGDMFERVEARADVYLLKDVLHDWDDERCARILATVRATMPAGSRVVLAELLVERDEPHPIATVVDLQMLTQCDGGRQRSAAELHRLLADAGLDAGPVRRSPLYALVEATAPTAGPLAAGRNGGSRATAVTPPSPSR